MNFCTNCGQKIPDIPNARFCIKCGLDFSNVNQLKKSTVMQSSSVIQYKFTPIKHELPKLSDEEIYEKSDRRLWGAGQSIGFSLLSLAILTGLSIVLVLIILLILINPLTIYPISLESFADALESLSEELVNLESNLYFLIISSLLEFSLILIPVIYVGRFLKRPSFKNRLALFGFTARGYSIKGVFKEIGWGVACGLSAGFIIWLISTPIDYSLYGREYFESFGTFSFPLDSFQIFQLIIQLFLLAVVMIAVVGPTEEIVFRGFLQKGLVRSKLKKWGGIVITALIFAGIHSVAFDLYTLFISFPLYFVISLGLGMVFYWRNENLIAVMIMHGVYNSFLIILTVLTGFLI